MIIDFIKGSLLRAGIILAVLIVIIVWWVNRKPKSARKQSSAPQVQRPPQPIRKDPEPPKPVPVKEPDPPVKELTIPVTYKGKQAVYHYDDVKLTLSGAPESAFVLGKELQLSDNGSAIEASLDGVVLGILPENRLSGMVRDWDKAGDPYLAYLVKHEPSGSTEIALAFYQDTLSKFLSRNPDAKKIKLLGKPDELCTAEVGMSCNVEYDTDKERYDVLANDDIIGYLPANALKYAEENGCEPEDLTVILCSIDYDIDKDRDFYSVYISD